MRKQFQASRALVLALVTLGTAVTLGLGCNSGVSNEATGPTEPIMIMKDSLQLGLDDSATAAASSSITLRRPTPAEVATAQGWCRYRVTNIDGVGGGTCPLGIGDRFCVICPTTGVCPGESGDPVVFNIYRPDGSLKCVLVAELRSDCNFCGPFRKFAM